MKADMKSHEREEAEPRVESDSGTVDSTAVTTGQVVSEEARRWAAGELDSETYFHAVWERAKSAVASETEQDRQIIEDDEPVSVGR